MRQQRTQRMSAPGPLSKAGTGLPFDMQDSAMKVARELKGRFPILQVKIYDAETKLSEMIELAAA